MLFKSRKDNLFTFMVAALLLLFVWITYVVLQKETLQQADYISISIIGIVAFFILWTFTTTNYTITPTHFNYKSGVFRGSIKLQNIHTIIKGQTMWVGLKPATAQNGLIIKYNKYEEIYISPETNETFITEILKYNPEINIQ